MANLRLAMDAAFWDLDISSAQTLEGTARFVSGEPAPLSTARSSRTLRPQQLSFFRRAFPLGIIPCFSPPFNKDPELGSFSFQSLLFGPSSDDWWVGLVGQFRPKKLVLNIMKEVTSGDELEIPAFMDVAKHVVDKALYALGLFSQVSITDDTSLLFNVERHGDRKRCRSKVALWHKLPDHDVTLEAAWPELFLDRKGTYWEVPASASLNIASLVSRSGLRYRFGLQRNSGHPEALNSSSGDVPTSLMPGTCAKAAVSFEKSRDLWRDSEKKSSQEIEVKKEPAWMSSYDVRLAEPHAAISGIVGATCSAWFGGIGKMDATVQEGSVNGTADHTISLHPRQRQLFTADMFGSLSYTIQRGKFKTDFNDLTRVDARLDISSASSFIKGAQHIFSDILKGRADREVNPLAVPRVNVVLQQQLAGPIVFRVDSKVSLSSPTGKHVPHVDDVIYGLSYSLRMLQSGKILAWFSPKRKEAMVELRFFEF